MKLSKLPWLNLRHFWRMNVPIVLGMAVGATVLTGALVIGDSVRGSLRAITLDRLGKIDYALVANGFFRGALAAELAGQPGFSESFDSATPVILMTASIEHAGTGAFARGINLLGVEDSFWELGPEASPNASRNAPSGASPSTSPETFRPTSPPAGADADLGAVAPEFSGRTTILNERLARELGASPGDSILLRLEKPDPIPSEAVHGRKLGKVTTIRLKVAAVVSNRGLGRFGLSPSQQLPLNAYVPLETLQKRLGQAGSVNALFVSARGEGSEPGPDLTQDLQRLLKSSVELADLNLRLRVNADPAYLSLESTRMVLREGDIAWGRRAARALGMAESGALTYLANSMRVGAKEIPYSTITALDFSSPSLGKLTLLDGSPAPLLEEDEVLLNEWAARELEAGPGDSLSLTYYITGPQGEFQTTQFDGLVVRGVVAMEGLGLDPGLTPEYPGISDATSIRDWDPPFPVDLAKIGDRDEAYWEEYRAVPKAFISLLTGLRLWTSRFGRLTSLRLGAVPGEGLEASAGLFKVALLDVVEPAAAGLVFQPVKLRGLEASKGATDFGMLFIGFSFFIIVAAMMLVRLLFALALQLRAREIGLLKATGFDRRAVGRVLLIEGALLACVGSALGAGLGVGYAWLMLYGLRTWWVGAVGTTFLFLHVKPASVLIGAFIGFATAELSVYLGFRSLAREEPARLLSRGALLDDSPANAERSRISARRLKAGAFVCGALAVVFILSTFAVSATAQAALFYSSGTALLAASFMILAAQMSGASGGVSSGVSSGASGGPLLGASISAASWPLLSLGARNAYRNRGRSLSTSALIAAATFIIVAVAANRHGTSEGKIEKISGNGGFALLAETDVPVLVDLNDPSDRYDLGLGPDVESSLAGVSFYPFRLSPGEEASCLNLYRPARPRLLGASESFIRRGGFAFQGALDAGDAGLGGDSDNPWRLLDMETDDGTIPAIGDLNTVMWILHSGLGKVFEMVDDNGKVLRLKFVALLKGSALQGELVISEKNFVSVFPERGGYRFFLIDTADGDAGSIRQVLEAGLRDLGFDATSTAERIAAYRAVENTYLSTFQALGGLGLLLGTLGLAVVMARNVVERRGEIGLLSAVGYGPRAVATLVLAENAFLLAIGMIVGAGSALLSVAPNVFRAGSGIQWGSLLLTLLAILVAGLLAGSIAVVIAIRTPILDALRSD